MAPPFLLVLRPQREKTRCQLIGSGSGENSKWPPRGAGDVLQGVDLLKKKTTRERVSIEISQQFLFLCWAEAWDFHRAPGVQPSFASCFVQGKTNLGEIPCWRIWRGYF